MKKSAIYFLASLVLSSGCSSDESPYPPRGESASLQQEVTVSVGGDAAERNGSLLINGRYVYLRGEMNDYAVSETFRLRRDKQGWCTESVLRADWSPYKFKFADEQWTAGSNFGYAVPPGTLRESAKPVKLNPAAQFEEVSFHLKEDGVFKFCLIRDKSGDYYAQVYRLSLKEARKLGDMLRQDNGGGY